MIYVNQKELESFAKIPLNHSIFEGMLKLSEAYSIDIYARIYLLRKKCGLINLTAKDLFNFFESLQSLEIGEISTQPSKKYKFNFKTPWGIKAVSFFALGKPVKFTSKIKGVKL